MRKGRILLMAVASLTIANAHAELNDFQVEMAQSVGRTDAAMFDSMKPLYQAMNSSVDKEMNKTFIMQATMMGCTTKEDIQQFMTIAKKAAKDQMAVIAEVQD